MSETNASDKKNSLRRPLLILLTLFVCCYFGWIGSIVVRIPHRRASIARLESLGGVVEYSEQTRPSLIEVLAGNEAFNTVESVALNAVERLDDEALAVLREFPEIKSLFLGGKYITDGDIQYVAQLPKLEWLGLASTGVTAEGIAQLAEVKGLEKLYLSGITVTDDTLTSFSKLSKLRELGFAETQFKSTDFGHLAGLPNLRG